MAYTVDDLASVLGRIYSYGIEGVIIGSTVFYLKIKEKQLKDDIDLFVTKPSPLVEEEEYVRIAYRESWEISYTDIGTPRFIIKHPSGEIIVEFYENIHDFYIPEEIISSSTKIRIRNVDIKIVHLEDYIVLKAKAARESDIEFLKQLKTYINKGRIKINKKRIQETISLFPHEEQSFIRNKLYETGIIE